MSSRGKGDVVLSCVDPRGALFTVPLKKAKDPNEPKEGTHAAKTTEATEAKSPEARVQDADTERVRVGRTDTPASLGLHDGASGPLLLPCARSRERPAELGWIFFSNLQNA